MSFDFESLLIQHQTKLVRWCAALSGNPHAAEDLAQETCLEAWRNQHKVVEPDGFGAWLFAVARNVCLRWRHAQGRSPLLYPLDEELIEADDWDSALNAEDRASLLDQAMGLLPADARALLSARYFDDLPLAELASRWKTSPNGMAVRLHRSKAALKAVIQGPLSEQAALYGWAAEGSGDWQTTRLWCYVCGRTRLLAYFNSEQGDLSLHCPGCGFDLDQSQGMTALIGGLKSLKSAVKRLMNWSNEQYFPSSGQPADRCRACGETMAAQTGLGTTPRGQEMRVARACTACGWGDSLSLYGHAIHTPAGQCFWDKHGRIFVLPQQTLEVDGHAAVLTRYQSQVSTECLEVVVALDVRRVLRINGQKP
jgi:RNA polymerase sigma factor (sigma-70 family)